MFVNFVPVVGKRKGWGELTFWGNFDQAQSLHGSHLKTGHFYF